MMKKEGKKITRQDMEDFLEKTGADMGNISQELEKLLSYTMGRDVITGRISRQSAQRRLRTGFSR